jgi:hypothetical protein
MDMAPNGTVDSEMLRNFEFYNDQSNTIIGVSGFVLFLMGLAILS